MSASYWLEIDAGADWPARLTESFNVTYNLGPMLRAAGFPDWEALRDAPASEVAGVLDGVSKKLRADQERLVAEFTPDNGWGNWKWALEFTEAFRDACAENPKATIGASL